MRYVGRAVLVSLLVTSCGSGTREAIPTREGSGCVESSPDGEVLLSAAGRFAAPTTWIELVDVSDEGPATAADSRPGERELRGRVEKVHRGQPPEASETTVIVSEPVVAAMEDAGTARMIVAMDPGTQRSELAVVVNSDASVRVPTSCSLEDDLNRFVARRAGAGDSRKPADIVREVVALPQGPAGQEFAGRRAEMVWVQRDPRTRVIEQAPAAEKRGLYLLSVELVVPSAWRSFEGHLCSRIPSFGVSECAEFDAAPPGQSLFLNTWVRSGAAFELILTGADNNLRSPRAVVHRQPGGSRLASLRLRADEQIDTVDELIARSRSGPPPFTAAPS